MMPQRLTLEQAREQISALLDVAQKAQEYVENRSVGRFTALREALAKLKAGS
jgi:hypothetical protein